MPRPARSAVLFPPAPFDAMAYNGIQVNGGMAVNQEHPAGGFHLTPGDVYRYPIDGWGAGFNQATLAGLTFFVGQTTPPDPSSNYALTMYPDAGVFNPAAGS